MYELEGGFNSEAQHPFRSTSRQVLVARLLLTPNGKLDTAVLPAPDDMAHAQPAHVAPETDTERTLAAVWADGCASNAWAAPTRSSNWVAIRCCCWR